MLAPANDIATRSADIPHSPHPSRRAVLSGAAGGAAALVALLTRPARIEAAAGSPLIIGSPTNNAGASNTILSTSSTVVAFELIQNGPGTALMGYATATSGGTRGIYGRTDSQNGDGVQARNASTGIGSGAAIRAFGGKNTAVIATSDGGDGVHAVSNTGAGVTAISTSGNGVSGVSTDASGVYGLSTHASSGVYGTSALGAGVIGTGATYGVYGSASGGYGVFGQSETASGVAGASSGGDGVYGSSNSHYGVHGTSVTSYAGYFSGRMGVTQFIDFLEMAAPAAPVADTARVFVRDNAGKTELCVLFNDGVVQVLAAQP